MFEFAFILGCVAAIVSSGLVYRALGGPQRQPLMRDVLITAVTVIVSGTAASLVYIAFHLETLTLGEGTSKGLSIFFGGSEGLIMTMLIRGNWRRRRSQA